MIEFRELTASDVEIRIGQCSEKGASLLLYKDARCDMRILDESVGPENWDCAYTEIAGKLFCTVGINCGEGTYTNWVYKQDVGVPSNMESEKGEASDAFKRACFKWGIGRELYTAPFIWIPAEKLKKLRRNERTGKWQCYDRFTVKRMKVADGKIANLAIANENGVLVFGNPYDDLKAEKAEKRAGKFARIAKLKKTALQLGIKEEGIKSWLDVTFGKPMKDFDSFEIEKTEKYLQGLVDDAVELRARANSDVGNPNA